MKYARISYGYLTKKDFLSNIIIKLAHYAFRPILAIYRLQYCIGVMTVGDTDFHF